MRKLALISLTAFMLSAAATAEAGSLGHPVQPLQGNEAARQRPAE